jgi:hypothetical protein
VPVTVYEGVRSHPRRLLSRPGHEHGELETVVVRADDYDIVEKTGDPGRIADQTDPCGD